ncbi:L-type lectin-domain containing receptor kinase IV.1-like [Benincasa hispida]|uniref:L-type lectin-domain containing receptor kinase IV.1-like n=1 Tax=Benincasa hispida TaxID=102211 RepID=UPI0019022EE8|nr:L-type lectin-domain containing receptor kinase IV.1-like [Benincasa hispida]
MAAIVFFTLILLIFISLSSGDQSFTFNGFHSGDLFLDGVAEVTSNGLLKLTNDYDQQIGHAFYPNSISFKTPSNSSSVSSFSATFVFAIISEYDDLGGHGIAFVVSPTSGLPGARPSESLGLFNESNNGNETNHVFAVELDTIQNLDLRDINKNHVGININGLVSEKAERAGYWVDSDFRNLTLISGEPMQVWVEYDGFEKQINVTLAPIEIRDKPKIPLLSYRRDLSSVINDIMYVGFSSSTGSITTSHYVLAWSFSVNGEAQRLALSQLPNLPSRPGKKQRRSKFLTVGLPLISVSAASMTVSGVIYFIYRRRKFGEILEDWELEYGPQRFKYKDLYRATKGFREKEFLGFGGFGRVYKGVLPNSKMEVAVKKISHESRQGMKEFVAEIVSVGRLRHRNLVALLGYCRRKGELFLVYDYMKNGSLDSYLHEWPEITINWEQRFEIIKGVASGLFYLHEQCEKVVIHRDVKASNVLLDDEFNGRLGDFGLAKMYDRGADPRTTHVVGTLGYLAPEHIRTGRATTRTDVYAFGAFLLEVACGRRPIHPQEDADDFILMDWVFSCWINGHILQTVDPKLGGNFEPSQLELVLKLGLLCSHYSPSVRPTMHQVLQYLEAAAPLPDLSSLRWRLSGSGFFNLRPRNGDDDGLDDFTVSYPLSTERNVTSSSSVAESILSDGR